MPRIQALSAVTLATRDMRRAVDFYLKLGFEMKYGGYESDFTSFYAGDGYLNLILVAPQTELHWWGRAIFHVDDVDAVHAHALSQDLKPQHPPRDAPWGERYFHITDPDGHEISLARPLVP